MKSCDNQKYANVLKIKDAQIYQKNNEENIKIKNNEIYKSFEGN